MSYESTEDFTVRAYKEVFKPDLDARARLGCGQEMVKISEKKPDREELEDLKENCEHDFKLSYTGKAITETMEAHICQKCKGWKKLYFNGSD